MKGTLVDHFQYLGIGQHAREVLEGTYTAPPGISVHTTQWINHLQWAAPPCYQTGPTGMFKRFGITTQDHVNGWKWANERTSPGHSGLTTAHWKAACRDPFLASMDAAWANIPYITGYSPLRWQRGVDVLIPKKAGDDRVDHLRPILLFEVDANQNNKRMGKVMMRMAEANGGISPEQYGSRKGRSSAEQALNKRLTFDILRQERRSAVDVSVDLRSCYDLVTHSAASLSMQRQGLPEQPIVCMFTSLQNMVHTVKTSFGESDRSFGGKLWAFPFSPPPQGLGQGNGAGPAIWAVVSSPVLEMLRSSGHGASFELAISRDTVQLVGFAFVDDSDLIETAASLDELSHQILARSQRGLDTFVGGMAATGGQVRPDKCRWCQISFKWSRGKWVYTDPLDGQSLFVQTPEGRVPIQRSGPSDAVKTLGIWQAPDGNNKRAIEEMREISSSWADKVRAGFLLPHEAWTALMTTISKSLEYPLLRPYIVRKRV